MALEDKYINPLTDFEIAKFSKAERELYEESFKYYRDIKNVVDTDLVKGK